MIENLFQLLRASLTSIPETSGQERAQDLADLVLDEAVYLRLIGQASPEEQQLQEEQEEDEEDNEREEYEERGGGGGGYEEDEHQELIERNITGDIERPHREIQQEMVLTNPFRNVHLAYANSIRQQLERITPFQRHPTSCPFALQQYRRCFPVQNATVVVPRYVPFIESPLILSVNRINAILSFCSVGPEILSQFMIQQREKELFFLPFQTNGGEDR